MITALGLEPPQVHRKIQYKSSERTTIGGHGTYLFREGPVYENGLPVCQATICRMLEAVDTSKWLLSR
ncbi:hypothetical protein OH492_28740 [Vibrio chagasii]|nr:hypothetical protein [Vibrio chagasii]